MAGFNCYASDFHLHVWISFEGYSRRTSRHSPGRNPYVCIELYWTVLKCIGVYWTVLKCIECVIDICCNTGIPKRPHVSEPDAPSHDSLEGPHRDAQQSPDGRKGEHCDHMRGLGQEGHRGHGQHEERWQDGEQPGEGGLSDDEWKQ